MQSKRGAEAPLLDCQHALFDFFLNGGELFLWDGKNDTSMKFDFVAANRVDVVNIYDVGTVDL